VRELADERGVTVVGMLDRAAMEDESGVTKDLLSGADVALEFSTPSTAVANIGVCLDAGCPVVVGTTGWYEQLPAVEASVEASGGSLLWASNFSVGIALLAKLVERAGELASGLEQFDVQMTETHHTAKRDAPSGTALTLEGEMSRALGRRVPITSVRTGFVPGTHEVTLDGPFERITLAHEARDRRVFADGALTAAAWLTGRKGVFTMADVFGEENR
jgi:4-hydroxy-tetrahydrodipicolinate reductase